METKQKSQNSSFIFIDESGDPGFRFKQGSSQFFVIALIIFKDMQSIEDTANILKDFKLSMGKSYSYELKFHSLNRKNKLRVLSRVKHCEFKINSLVLDKRNIEIPYLRKQSKSYYYIFLKELFERNKTIFRNSRIRLDGSGNRIFRRAMINFIKGDSTKNEIKDFKFVDSNSDNIIQLADLIAGSINRSYQENKKDRFIYKEIIKEKIEDEGKYSSRSSAYSKKS